MEQQEIAQVPQPINEGDIFMQLVTGFMKGTGRWPTSLMLQWAPTFKNPLRFILLDVSKCNVDGGVVTKVMSQRLRSLHSGHRIGSPKMFTWWEFIKVQLRVYG